MAALLVAYRTTEKQPTSRYSGNMHKHFMYGDDKSLP
jgi:hypothetical protein